MNPQKPLTSSSSSVCPCCRCSAGRCCLGSRMPVGRLRPKLVKTLELDDKYVIPISSELHPAQRRSSSLCSLINCPKHILLMPSRLRSHCWKDISEAGLYKGPDAPLPGAPSERWRLQVGELSDVIPEAGIGAGLQCLRFEVWALIGMWNTKGHWFGL